MLKTNETSIYYYSFNSFPNQLGLDSYKHGDSINCKITTVEADEYISLLNIMMRLETPYAPVGY